MIDASFTVQECASGLAALSRLTAPQILSKPGDNLVHDGMIVAEHWRIIDETSWRDRFPNFWFETDKIETDNGSLRLNFKSMERIQAVRTAFGKPLVLNCAYRNLEHNRRVGGGKQSQHLRGRAFDVRITGDAMGRELETLAFKAGFTAIGRYPSFIHLDDRAMPSGRSRPFRWGRY